MESTQVTDVEQFLQWMTIVINNKETMEYTLT